MPHRREFVRGALGGLAIAGAGLLAPRAGRAQAPAPALPSLPAGAIEAGVLDALPGKRPLIKRSYRPPNYESPVASFNEEFTPNDAFFVRYHHADIPVVDAGAWTLQVDGEAAVAPVAFTLAELRQGFEQVEIAAVLQCSGNRRGLAQPHVPGVQWGYGAMGNARWRGVRLRDVIQRAGVRPEAIEVAFAGTDRAVAPGGPDFVKSLPVAKALDENVLVALEMNGEPLPHWNGHPARLVVPGWTGTYWLKHLAQIELLARPLDGFWMKTAYRIPRGSFALVERFASQETDTSTPITEILVNSLFTNVEDGQSLRLGQALEVRGIAWDGGYGIQGVQFSVDGGQTWREAELGRDRGRFSWITWGFRFAPAARGSHALQARATNRLGATQVRVPIANPAGYHHNAVQTVRLEVA